MKPLFTPVPAPALPDEDLHDQARAGHGIPSQDPDPAAQIPIEPEEAQRESHSVLLGGALVAGTATGAAVGVALAGPVGIVVGATLGAVVGAIGGAAAGDYEHPPGSHDKDSVIDSGVRLHIDDTGGNGRPVVLIHGWPLSGQAWSMQVSALQAAGHRVVTYDRRGFGRSDKPESGYDYDTLADDLQVVLAQCDLHDVTLVGFSMGGGEVARYVSRFGQSRLRSVVFASAVTPCLMQTPANPEGPLTPEAAHDKKQALTNGRSAFFEKFTQAFFSAHGVLQVTEAQRQDALHLCLESAPRAALDCMDAFSTTDFREDLKQVSVPTLVIHGDADGIVPIDGSGLRTHAAVPHSQLVVVKGAPHGMNVSHPQAFNEALLAFLGDGGAAHL